MRKIIVNATALTTGGGVTILNQFVDHLSEEFEYLIFINAKLNIQSTKTNIIFIKKNASSILDRLILDFYGIKWWLRKNKVYPSATISLQNINFKFSNTIPNFIYFHQALPFSSNKWNLLKKNERKLWFYKNIYPFLIKLSINKNTEIFVQTNFIREKFANYFNFPIDKIHVITPKLNPLNHKHVASSFSSLNFNWERLNIFYPATLFPYKNHKVIVDALSNLNPKLRRLVTLHLTCELNEWKQYLSVDNGFKINFLGEIPHSKVLETYLKSDALLFPSYIETYGLPLIEAASLGLPIVVSDLPYAREVLTDYNGARFVPYDNPLLWKNEIINLFQIKGKKFQPHVVRDDDSWQKIFQILNNRINQNVQH